MSRRMPNLILFMMICLLERTVFPSAFPAAAGDAREKGIPLVQAIENGFLLDAQYRNRRLDVEMAGLELRKARMKKFFHVDFAASYLFKSQQMEISFPDSNPAPGVVIPGMDMKAGAKHNYDLKLALVQPIFTGNILTTSVEMESQKQLREGFNSELRKIEVAGLIKSSYFTYRLLESKKKSLALLVENLKLHLDYISAHYKEDLVRKSDLLETKIKLADIELSLEELCQLLAEEKINFTKLCGFAAEDIAAGYEEDIGSFQESLAFFESRHPVLQVINLNIDILGLQKKMIAGSYLPQVNGFAELHYGRPGIDFFKNRWSMYFQGGISLNLNVFDWNRLRQDKQLVDMSVQKLDNSKEDLSADVEKKLAQLYSKEQSLQKQLALARQLVITASEDAELKEDLYKEQQLPNLDYLSALLDKERFLSRLDELVLQICLIKLNINTIIGRLGEQQ